MERRQVKLIILACILVILGYFVCRQSTHLYQRAFHLQRPSVESRQIGDLRIHRWMSVAEVASRCHVSETQIFAALKIDPVPGDEKLPLRALQDKYHKSEEEMRAGLLSLIKSNGARGDHHHE